jgi:PAS domain-containing protein
MLQLAEAVHHIHQHQVVHGDIKPDNLILCPVPSTDRRKSFMKLLDFGLARPATVSGPITSTVAGTPQYIAPERLRGEPPQPSMDIYAVGVVGYELLCGRPPFDGAISDVIDAHLDQAPPPFSTHGITHVDERAEALIMRALAKSPANRQASMAAFLYELRTLMAMLGMGRRRAVTTARPTKRDDQDRARGRLFDVAPIPLAGVDATGRIVIANKAFAKFVTGELEAETAGVSVAATRLTEVFPDIMAELRQVHISGNGAKRVIRLRAPAGESVDLLVWMMPGSEASGDVTLAIHPLPRA